MFISPQFHPDVRREVRDRAQLPTSVRQSPKAAVAAEADSGHRKEPSAMAPSGDRQGRHSNRALPAEFERTKAQQVPFLWLVGELTNGAGDAVAVES